MSQRWGDWPWFSGQDLQPQRGRDPALPTWFTLSINQGVQLGALLASETNRMIMLENFRDLCIMLPWVRYQATLAAQSVRKCAMVSFILTIWMQGLSN